MALTVEDVLAVVAPSYVADSRVTAATSIAETWIEGYTCLSGNLRITAKAAIVAHLLTVGDREQAAANGGDAGGVVIGGVTAQAAGQVSQSYGMLGAGGTGGYYSDDVLRTTPGGLEWLRIRGGLPCARRVGWVR